MGLLVEVNMKVCLVREGDLIPYQCPTNALPIW